MSLIAELKRRNVFRVAAAYVVVAWVIAQVAEFAFENFGSPDWVLKSVVVILVLGLPVALIFAWAFEMTPEGIKRESQVDRSKSIVSQTGRKLDRVIIGVLAIAVGWLAIDKFVAAPGDDTAPQSANATSVSETPREKSVAVLPFVAMSSGPDDEYFADGLTEEILNSLAQLPELLVTARTSAFSFKGQDLPVQEIAAALGVNHIVEGSVRRSGERLRVTAQLIRADDGFHLWSENYDSTSIDTISVQENIAEQIASVMDVVLDESKREAMRNVGLRDAEAFTLYQKGLDYYNRAHGDIETITGLRQANEYFEQVIERVPTFAPVYIEHSDLYAHILSDVASGVFQAAVTEEEIASAYANILSDYELARKYSTSEAQVIMADLDLAYIQDDWRGIGLRIQQASNLPGCHTGNWIQILAPLTGYAEAYLEHALRVLECDPASSQSWFNVARTVMRTGDVDRALQYAQEGMQAAPGGWLPTSLARALVAKGRYDEATEVIEAMPLTEARITFRALVAAAQGNQDEVASIADGFLEQSDSAHFWLVLLAAWAGDRDESNRRAALIDDHRLGPATLAQLVLWCGCGAPFDLEATPNLAARIKEGNLPWPPEPIMEFPLKTW